MNEDFAAGRRPKYVSAEDVDEALKVSDEEWERVEAARAAKREAEREEEMRRDGSLCAGCPLPGLCCKEIRLFGGATPDGLPVPDSHEITWWLSTDEEIETQVQERMPHDDKSPFKVRRILERWVAPPDHEHAGAEYGTVAFSCSKLLPNGRCGDYDNRPNLCKIFKPGRDTPCAQTKRFAEENGDHYGDLEIEHSTPGPIYHECEVSGA